MERGGSKGEQERRKERREGEGRRKGQVKERREEGGKERVPVRSTGRRERDQPASLPGRPNWFALNELLIKRLRVCARSITGWLIGLCQREPC